MRPNHRITPYLFVLPALAVFGFAVIWPLILTAGYSVLDWNGYGTAVFVGLDNFSELLGDILFRDSFVHVIGYIAVTLVLEVVVGLVLAGLVSARGGALWFRVAVFAPVLLPMVVVAVLWSFVYNPDFGLVNAGLEAIGLADAQRAWLGDPSTALLAICVVSGWVFAGFYMTIFYAALSQLPGEVIEAARLDGASEWQLFWRIKVPMLRNSIEVAVLLCVTGGFQGFDLFYVLTGGGPYYTTEIPTTYLVRTVFRNGDVGYGAAMAVVLTVIVAGIGILFARVRAAGARREVRA